MKKFAVLFVLFIALMCNSPAHAQTSLGDGGIIIIGYNSDNPDEFAFMLMTDVTSGTQIKFTDNGWFAAGGFRANEGVVQWEADQNYPGGWVVVIDTTNDTASTGSLSNISGSLALSGSGDQVIAYQGLDTSPNFLYAIQMNGGAWDADATSSNTSAQPTGLTNYIVISPERDNAVYDMSVVGGPVATILAAVNNQANWSSSDTRLTLPTGDTTDPTAVSLQSFTGESNNIAILSSIVMLVLMAGGTAVVAIRRRNR